MAFLSAHHLKRHVALHMQPTPYACTEPGCNMAFSKQCKLKRHMCTHTGKLPYECSVSGCSSSFSFPSQLKKHLHTVHAQQQQQQQQQQQASPSSTHNKPAISKMEERDAEELHVNSSLDNAQDLEQTHPPHPPAPPTSTPDTNIPLEQEEADNSHRPRRVSCGLCGILVRRSGLKAHLATHSPDRRLFYCNYPIPCRTSSKQAGHHHDDDSEEDDEDDGGGGSDLDQGRGVEVGSDINPLSVSAPAQLEANTTTTTTRPCGRAFTKVGYLYHPSRISIVLLADPTL